MFHKMTLAVRALQRFLEANAEGYRALDFAIVVKVYPTIPFKK